MKTSSPKNTPNMKSTPNTKNSPKKYKSEAGAALHEMMSGFHEVGAISKISMREFDARCLTPIET
jgi:hypothetical protein